MGTLSYPGVPDLVYNDKILATIQAIIATQQKMGQGFWLERRGIDDGMTVGHDAIWINPAMHISIEFDSIDDAAPDKDLFEQWKMLLIDEGADRLVIHPNSETMELVKRWIDEGDSSLPNPV